MQQREFIYGDYNYSYGLIRQDRKTLSLTVYPDRRIVLKCPLSAREERIRQFMKRKWLWLNKQLRFFQNKKPESSKEHLSGESFRYLGRQYKLIVKSGPKDKVVLSRGRLNVISRGLSSNGAYTGRILQGWYKKKAGEILSERFEACLKNFSHQKKPKLLIRTMRTRWGSCTKAGKIILNRRLIQAPSHCIDYVIMHELCHLLVHNHSPKYYKLLTRMMPDWQSRKKRLEQIAVHNNFGSRRFP